MKGIQIKLHVYQYMPAPGILVIALSAPVDAAWEDDEFTPSHLRSDRSVWNSGTLDAGTGSPIGFDGSADYMLDYTEERDRLRQEELLDAIEDLDNE